MATRNRPHSMRQPAQIRDNLAVTDPGLILKEKIEAAQTPALNSAPAKDDLTDPGLILKKKIQSGQISTGTPILTATSRRSAHASIGPAPSTASSNTVKTPYKLRGHRTKIAAAASANGAAASSAEATGEPADELTKEQQQARDLFGEDYQPQGPGTRTYTPHLNESEMETRSVDQLESYAILRSQVRALFIASPRL